MLSNRKSHEDLLKTQRRSIQSKYQHDLIQQMEDTRAQKRSQDNWNSTSPVGHNPVTNPIDFKMDVRNKYVVNELSQAKGQLQGDRNLRLNHLALLGNQSLVTP